MNEKDIVFEEITCKLPCNNLLEYIEYFLSVFNNKDIKALDYLLDSEFSEYKELFTRFKTEDMFHFVIFMLFRCDYNRPYEQEKWLDFNHDDLNELLKSPFYDEYCDTFSYDDSDKEVTIHTIEEMEYIWIEFYTYFKVLSMAASVLPHDRTHMLWYYLCYEDIIDIILMQGYHSIIGNIYISHGWEWFSSNRYGNNPGFDLLLYKWGYYSIIAGKKLGLKKFELLKMDFIDLFTDFSIKCAQAESHPSKDELLKYFKYELQHFDDDRLNQANVELKKQGHLILALQNDIECLKRSYQLAIDNIKLIQGQIGVDESDKINRILKHLYACLPNKLKGIQLEKRFEEIWENLSEQSRTDITQAIQLFELMKNFEFSSLALLRSLERELELNVFKPFRDSEVYANAHTSGITSNADKLERINRLLKGPVTLGAIPILAGVIKKENTIENGTILAAFIIFLGKQKDIFREICSKIGRYKVGDQSLSIINIRNGIAHGDTEVTEHFNEACYHSIFKFIYEPPIQIMFSIILNSFKK